VRHGLDALGGHRRHLSDQAEKAVDLTQCALGFLGRQFKAGQINTFQSYSKFPPCLKDIAFWLPEGFEPNDFFELGRGVCGELVEKIELVDEFTNAKKGKTSHCYRITYRSMERSLTNEEINVMQEQLREQAATKLKVELR
jgi:phenylalanyl-tRNA synthetase alpha chain